MEIGGSVDIHRLYDDGTSKVVMFGVLEKEIDAVLKALPSGRYFYFENGMRIFSEKPSEAEVNTWLN